MTRLMLLDSNGLIYRGYHALPPLTTSRGELVNAVFGFCSILLRGIQDVQPEYVAACFDLPGPTFRHEQFAAYKATRAPMPDDLRSQFPKVREVVAALRIPVYELAGFEADDVIGTITRDMDARGIDTTVVTGDLDMLQIVTDRTRLMTTRQGVDSTIYYDPAKIWERFELRPDQMIDYKALKGDPTDNIPGIPGVGEKTAAKLVGEFGSLEGIYARLAEVKPDKLRDKLVEAREQVFASRELSRIVRDLPISLDLEASRLSDYDRAEVVRLFREFEFRSLIDRLPPLTGESAVDAAEALRSVAGSVAAVRVAGEAPRGPRGRGRSLIAAERGCAAAAVDGLRVDRTERAHARSDRRAPAAPHRRRRTRGSDRGIACGSGGPHAAGSLRSHRRGRGRGDGLAGGSGRGGRRAADGRPASDAWHAPGAGGGRLRRSRAGGGRTRRGRPAGGPAAPVRYARRGPRDQAAHGGEHRRRGHSATPRGLRHSDRGLPPECLAAQPDHRRRGPRAIGRDAASRRRRAPAVRIGLDALAALAVREPLEKALVESGLERLFREVELPLIPVLAEMEAAGVAIDRDALALLDTEFGGEMARLESEIYADVGHEFNLGSPKQLEQILFYDLNLPKGKRTKTGYSTDASVLEELKPAHPMIGKLLDWRLYSKLRSTYIEALPALVSERDGRLHTTFHQAVAATGRLSSSDPNLQNIPIRSELGRRIRRAFVAGGPDVTLLAADYSQIELRILAHVSGDEHLRDAFARGADIHRETAARVLHKAPEDVTHDERSMAKMVNFGLAYGMSDFGLSSRAGISRAEAKEFIDNYFATYSGISYYMLHIKELARQQGYVSTLLGRRRSIPELRMSNPALRGAGERMAINMPIQGTAADIIKIAMIRLPERLRSAGLRSRMLLQVHDELVLEVPRGEVEAAAPILRETMESALKLDVPLTVDVKVGDDWESMRPLTREDEFLAELGEAPAEVATG